MYVTNPEKLKNTYKCKKAIAEYLMEKCNIPLLSHEKYDEYYFMNTEELKNAIKTIPLLINIRDALSC
jgi:hypothetical protein